MTQSVGVIGLGAMGMGMARSLLAGGFSVTAFDLSPQAMARAKDAGIAAQETPAGVIEASDIIVLSLPLASHVDATIEAGLAAGAFKSPKIIIDTSTSEAAVSRKLAAKLSEIGHGFLDAPVSGGPQGAASGSLSVMLGGDAQWAAQAKPVLDALASKVMEPSSATEAVTVVGGSINCPGAVRARRFVDNATPVAVALAVFAGLR